MLDASRACPELQNARRVPLEPALEPQNARRGPLEPALEPQHARKVPLEPTAVRCVRFLRSKSAVFCSSVVGINRPRPGAADGSKWPLEPAPGPQMEPQNARNGRSSPPWGRRWLGMAARARPGAADGAADVSKWPQMTRNGHSSLPQSRRILDGCRSSLPWSRRMLDERLSSLPGTAECATGAARAWTRRMPDGGRSSLPWSSSMLEKCRSSP